ncbi:MAG: lipocalin-like domain-containing protein [Pseudohongiellaceae bacterium]
MQYLRFLFCLTFLVACSGQREEQARLSVGEVLGGDSAGFLRALAPRVFSFPADHGLHPGFRNEWWYLTGNLETATGRRFAYQVTFFSNALTPPIDTAVAPESAWHSERIWMAHVGLTDVAAGEHQAEERFSRENPGLAGAQLDPFRVWLENWQLTSTGNDFPWQLQVEAEQFAIDLTLLAEKAPVLQGENGFSRKSAAPGNASYYYSLTRLQTTGTIHSGGQVFRVSGASWLDREWSTSVLADDQSGWDWFSLQFNDGSELMYYRLRDLQGQSHPFSLGNRTDQSADQTLIRPEAIRLQELNDWRSPSGISYTTRWQMDYREQSWIIQAVLDDQWMDVSVDYWEGAVDILDPDSGAVLGHGFLEMVRQQ